MIGHFVMTENELLKRRPTPESVGMGSYTIDSHNVQRYVDENGHVHNEGDIGVPLPGPYEIAYGALVPKKGRVPKPGGAGLCIGQPHCFWLHSYGTGFYDSGAVGSRCSMHGHRRKHCGAGCGIRKAASVEKGQVLTMNDAIKR
jgi:hypothetical protein